MFSPIEVYYDGFCPLCQGVKKRLERVDAFRLLHFKDFRTEDYSLPLGVSNLELAERMHVRNAGSGKLSVGVYAFAVISTRLPVFWFLVPFIYLSIALGLGQLCYDFIAKRRLIIPVGQCDENGCPLPKR